MGGLWVLLHMALLLLRVLLGLGVGRAALAHMLLLGRLATMHLQLPVLMRRISGTARGAVALATDWGGAGKGADERGLLAMRLQLLALQLVSVLRQRQRCREMWGRKVRGIGLLAADSWHPMLQMNRAGTSRQAG